jgi:hypothetical protein
VFVCLLFIKERKMKFTKIALASMVLGGSLLLSACGGGDGGGSGLSLNGTAAVGAPVVGTVVATCKTGTGTAVSNADGSYTVNINGGAGPCLLKITPANGTAPMYSVSSGSGATQTANITPMTSYLVTYLRNVPGITAATPEAWFALPGVGALLADPVALNKRIVDDFVPALKALVPGLSISSASFLSTAFIANPASSTTDADLEKLKAALIATPSLVGAILTQLATAASNDPVVVAPTGATGAGS